MNAHALLSAQGWRGTGHSLHKSDDTIGLAKPLLLPRKDNTKGLGNKKHFTSDQWWMNAFDEQLKGLDTSHEGKVVQTVKSGKLNAIDKGRLSKYSLYTTFVSGGLLQGTLSTPEETEDSSSAESVKGDDKEAQPPKAENPEPKKESKEERRSRREEKRKRKEERRKRKEARALRRAARRERKSKKDRSESGDSAKEEKRLRRAKKEEKRRRREREKNKTGGS